MVSEPPEVEDCALLEGVGVYTGKDEVLNPPAVDEETRIDVLEALPTLDELEDCVWSDISGVYTTTGEDDISNPPPVDEEIGLEVCKELPTLDELKLIDDA